MSNSEINERAQRLLNALIGRYIQEGKPVGSQKLAETINLEISSATVRNVMAELEQLGYVTSPHTSAGRIPTTKGYRFFVDSFLRTEAIDSSLSYPISDQLDLLEGKDLPGLIDSVSDLLSRLTKLAGVVTLPRSPNIILRHVDFLALSNKRVLVIMVVNELQVQNKVLQLQNDFSPSELEQAANFINEHYAGQDLRSVRDNLLKELNNDRVKLNRMMLATMQLAQRVFDDPAEEKKNQFVLTGQDKLLSTEEMTDPEVMRRLFEAFSRKSVIVQLLDQCITAEGVQIFIGQESGYDELDKLSVVTAPYSTGGEIVGVLGVIGPQRMHYDRVISVVDITSKLLGAALNQLR